MKLDLHVHTHTSDGKVSPRRVVSAAIAGGLDVIAIADHDTAAGVEEAWRAAATSPLRVIAAIEVSTRYGEQDLHILGYGIDPRCEPILQYQNRASGRREERMHGMIERLRGLGVPVEYDAVIRAAGPRSRSLGRPHLAQALLASGHTRSYGEAFERFLHDGGPAFVVQAFPTVREGIELIHAAGGLAVWAHPPLDVFDEEIRRFADWGLDGVECFRPVLPPSHSLLFERASEDLGLLRTGGSDWHGYHHGPLGSFWVRESDVRDFLEALSAG